MNEQPNLLDQLAEGRARRDQAIDQADDHADPDWKDHARRVLAELAATGQRFTTDELWRRLDAAGIVTHERRALGGIVRQAVNAGLIAPVGWAESTRPEAHAAPKRVYLGAGAGQADL